MKNREMDSFTSTERKEVYKSKGKSMIRKGNREWHAKLRVIGELYG